MGWEAQAGAGIGFLVVGLLQGFKQIRAYRLKETQKQRYHDADLYVIVVFALSHAICDLVVRAAETEAMHPVAASVNSQRLVVALNFLFYAAVTLVADNTRVLPLPGELVNLLALSAFLQEFLLFYLQREGAGLEGQYHYLLLVPIGVCCVATAAEVAYPRAALPGMVRSAGVVLQGTWFLQIAVSVFSAKWISQGCALKEEGEGDFTVTCEGMALMRGQGIATLQFNLHLALLLLTVIPLYALMCRLYALPQHYEPLGRDSDEAKELTHLKDSSSRVSPRTQFHVIQEDEELEEPTPRRASTDSNGFHNMVI